ncbi:MAG: beta-ketoacyl synthase N-terminal-like domain-containing protein, partial [Steroidobacteraceae bacterium]
MGLLPTYDKSWVEWLTYSDTEALAKLRRPERMEEDSDRYFLHPNMGNSVLEPAVLLSLIQDREQQWRFPYSLEGFWIFAAVPEHPYVYVRQSPGEETSGKFGKYDIDVVDETGVCAFMLRGLTAISGTAPWAAAAGARVAAGSRHLVEPLVRELREIAAALLKLDAQTIDPRTELSSYGFDSIVLTEFINELNRRYALELMPTIIFECPTLAALARRLARHHEPLLRSKLRAAPYCAAVTAEAAIGEAQVAGTPSERDGEPLRFAAPKEPDGGDGTRSEQIAVVGMSGRFPGCANVRSLWENILANRDMIAEVPAGRWDWRRYYGSPDAGSSKTNVKSGGFMADVDRFDPLFFGISPLEAQGMDPQLRLFMEYTWACIEDAGHSPGSLSGTKTGVFVGISTLDYMELAQRAEGLEVSSQGLFHFMVANRVSYVLNLRGPSEPIDTACSSSLVAIHRAVGCLRSGECEAALVGGVNVIASPCVTVGASQMG